ncbi:MAG TPA: HAMP domain-containing sensor histidine kinase [Candidatus Eisenbacteria bacterium]|nr:HAMP domain-containing sensor histidine kinase [Candidatus Eisenbacteria bacterium]
MIRFGPASLFWKLTGSFLLVLVLAIALQALVVVAVIEPIARRAARDRADTLLVSAAAEIADLFARVPADLRAARPGRFDLQIALVLRAHRLEAGPLVLQFRHANGRTVGTRAYPPGWRGGRGMMEGRRGMDEFPGPGGGPPLDVPPPAEGGMAEPAPGARPVRLQPLSRLAVVADGDTLGEVLALTAPRRLFFLPANVPGAMLLFFPIAILIAGAAGLLTVRSLTGRLRALEVLAARVAEGDLSARVAKPAADEIGGLGEALNRMAERLAAARGRAAEDERRRAQLVADISHELATPMTSIRGYAETLLNSAMPLSETERADYLRNILDESRRLDLLIQDLFELNRMEAGALPLATERLDWAALCRNTLRRFEPRFEAAGLTLAWEGSDGEAWVVADGRRLEQVLDNLLVNALRYVPPPGRVTLAIGRGAAPSTWRLALSDDGPGIAAKDLPHVFERFYRADEARTSGGSGLGLAIVRQIVVQHGGSARAEPRAPRGTVFLVELPAA